MSPPSTLFLLSLLPVALTLVPQPASDPTAFYNYPTGVPAIHHINGHLSNHTANKTHPHALPSFTIVPIDSSNRSLVDALNFGIYAGQKLAHRNCTNVVAHNDRHAHRSGRKSRHTPGIPPATATKHSSSSPTPGTFPVAEAAPPAWFQDGNAVGSLYAPVHSPPVHLASIQIHPRMYDPIAPQPKGMQDPAIAQAYTMGMTIGEQRCSSNASVFNVSTHHPGTKGALPPGVAKLDSETNSQIRPAEKRTPHSRLWYWLFTDVSRKRNFESDEYAWPTGGERMHEKPRVSRDIADDKVSQRSDTHAEKNRNHPQPSAATSIHPPRSLPWVYLLLLGFSVFISFFNTSMAAQPTLDPQLQTTGLVKRRANVICLEYRERSYPWPAGQAKRSGIPTLIDQQEPDLHAEAKVIDTAATLESKTSTLSCPGGTSSTCYFFAAKGFQPPRFLVGSSFLLLSSLLLGTHILPSAALVSPATKRHPNRQPVETPTAKAPPASPPNSGARSKSAPFPIPKPSRTLHLAALLLFTLLLSTARAAPADEMRHYLLVPTPTLLTPNPSILPSLIPTPTTLPSIAPRLRAGKIIDDISRTTTQQHAPKPPQHKRDASSDPVRKAVVGVMVGCMGLMLVGGLVLAFCMRRRRMGR